MLMVSCLGASLCEEQEVAAAVIEYKRRPNLAAASATYTSAATRCQTGVLSYVEALGAVEDFV